MQMPLVYCRPKGWASPEAQHLPSDEYPLAGFIVVKLRSGEGDGLLQTAAVEAQLQHVQRDAHKGVLVIKYEAALHPHFVVDEAADSVALLLLVVVVLQLLT